MLINFFKIFFSILLIIYQIPVYSKSNYINEFNYKDLSNYFSAKVSYDNQKNVDALKFFKSSKSLINKHNPYLKQYIFSLILDGKVKTAIKELKSNENKKNSDFFEAYLLLIIDSINKNDFKKTTKYLNNLPKFSDNDTLNLIIYESIKNYNFLFENKRMPSNDSTFSNLTLISRAFQSCYLDQKQTQSYFDNLIQNNEVDYSRYIFFYINNLIEQNKFQTAKEIADQIDFLNSSLLIMQTKNWIDNKKLEKFTEIFSCKSESNILSEFFYLIANLYSSQNDFEKSNFYINISNFLNPKFKFNLSLLVENYYKNNNYKKTENILNNFNENDDIYYWYKIKKKASIISNELGTQESLNFINSKFKKIKNPSSKILFDMANITKGLEEYETSIVYYNKVLSKISLNSESRAEILYRRGSCYERLGQFEKSDKDLLNSLEINPNDAYVLNYLAYSWLERNYKIDTSITMLEKAYKQKKNDPYILDSVGWAYYLVGDLIKAEQFLRKSIKIMPDDPIVNDHYGDILWAMNRKTQAKYYWQSVLNFENTEDDMKEKINIKLLKGPKKI
tara:strand:- start:287 stop:1975 length:1689 start_codon:yes stop_codon:yes gene_type:complete